MLIFCQLAELNWFRLCLKNIKMLPCAVFFRRDCVDLAWNLSGFLWKIALMKKYAGFGIPPIFKQGPGGFSNPALREKG